jgi:RHS repeat-associated protein
MNRLTNWNIYQNSSLKQNNSLTFNPTTGNIQTKSDLGGYTMNYGEEEKPPHALTSISGKPSIIPYDDQTITYTDFKKVKTISENGNVLNITYGTDEQRIKTVLTKSGSSLTRYYMGNYEEEIVGNTVRKIHYLCGGNGLAAVYIQNAGKDTLYYAHTDYQGSLIALSLPNGTVAERYAYDPWGKRRNPTNWTQTDTRTSFILNRGYTMHEHLTEFNLINMNGRVYDPLTAIFFSPDPYLQAPGNWLNYNRYGYCLNNPFKYTDPSGEFFWIFPYISWSQSGGWSFGISAGIGLPGGWSVQGTLDYSKSGGFTATVGASFGGASVYAGYNTKGGWMAGANFGFGPNIGYQGLSVFSNMTSIGIGFSQKGGFNANYLGAQYGNGNWSFDPSIGAGATWDSRNYGTYDVNVSDVESLGDPIQYSTTSAREFMGRNNLEMDEITAIYADGSLPGSEYEVREGGGVYNKKTNAEIGGVTKYAGKEYFLFGKQRIYMYLFKNSFSSPERLYLTIGHELVHVHLYYTGNYDIGKHEATAYTWSSMQAGQWGLTRLANDYYWNIWKIGNGKPYPYNRSIRIERPVR